MLNRVLMFTAFVCIQEACRSSLLYSLCNFCKCSWY